MATKHGLSIGAILNDLERPITRISRSRSYSMLYILVTAQGRDIQWKTNRNSYAVYRMVLFPMTLSNP